MAAVTQDQGSSGIAGRAPKRNITPIPSQNNMSSRASQRMERLAALEHEMKAEEKEALEMLMTNEQTETLMSTFDSVKTEFSDLDGMTWDKSSLPSTSSARTLKLDTDENVPPSPAVSPGVFPSSISLPALHFASPSNDDITVRVSLNAPLRSRLPSLPSKTEIRSSDIENDPQGYIKRAYDKGIKHRTPARGLFVSDNFAHTPFASRPRISTPFPLDIQKASQVGDVPNIGITSGLSTEQSDFSDLTVRSPRMDGTKSKKRASVLFGLGVQWPSGSVTANGASQP